MPLRDHFAPPMLDRSEWNEFHAAWPIRMCDELNETLPPEYQAAAEVRIGHSREVDVAQYRTRVSAIGRYPALSPDDGGGIATLTRPQASLRVPNVEFTEEDLFEVRIYKREKKRELVATLELVSPTNKRNEEGRQPFIHKCASLIHAGVCVSIVDIITEYDFNLYEELLSRIDLADPAYADGTPGTYAATCRMVKGEPGTPFESYSYPLAVAEPLPQLPIWISPTLSVTLDLEATYEKTLEKMRLA